MKGSKVKKVLASVLVTAIALSNIALMADATTNTNTKTKELGSEAQVPQKDLNRKIIGYFPEWAYDSESQGYFNAADLQWDDLTHIQYSFAMIDEKTHKIKLGNEKAAIGEDFTTKPEHKLEHNGKEVKLDPSLPYKGHFNALQTMKKQYPDVKLLISVGGWAASRGFYPMLKTDEGINTFADSCVEFIRQYGFDGVDIDFEYPSATATSGNPADKDLSEPMRPILNERYNLLMKTLREKLDAASSADKKTGTNKYILSAAVTASSWVLGGVSDNTYASYLDFLSVMSYDFHGGWNQYVENLANIYPDENDTETKGQVVMPTLCMDWAYRFYRGVLPPEKIIMGVPYYTRGWQGVKGGDGTGLHGTAGSKESPTPASGKYNIWGDDLNKDGILEPAGANPLWHVLNLMDKDPTMIKKWDDVGKVPHVWQPSDAVFLSFEDEQSIDERVKYINDKNLGGALIWVMNGDYDLNPNYDPKSTDVNKGKYTFGDTLTERLRNGLDKIGKAKDTDDTIPNLKSTNVEVVFGGKYDHPNNYAELTITNKSGAPISSGFEVAFDLPKSAIFQSVQSGSYTIKDNGDFNRVTITIPQGWPQQIEDGQSVKINCTITLCFGGVKNLTFNGMRPSNQPVNGNMLPVLTGVKNTSVNVNTAFNPLTGVKAVDAEEGDLTSKIVVTGSVNTKVPGEYKLTYTVKDSSGIPVTAESVVEVRPNIPAGYVWWDATGTYKNGDKVAYKGKLYTCTSWWIPNKEAPTDTKYWKYDGDIEVVKPVKFTIEDLAAAGLKYNLKSGQAGYDARLDTNTDLIIDIYDMVRIGNDL